MLGPNRDRKYPIWFGVFKLGRNVPGYSVAFFKGLQVLWR